MCPQLSRPFDDARPEPQLHAGHAPLARAPRRTRRWPVAATLGALALLGAACSKDNPPSATPGTSGAEPTTAGATTTTAAPATWPLTGLVGDPAAMNQPAIAVKVDNSPEARPHVGLNQADVVYEMMVDGVTRFMEIFHSQTPDRVGPVRSARSTDINLFSNLNRPIFVWSGGNGGVTAEIHQAVNDGLITEVVDNGQTDGPLFYRDRSRLSRTVGTEHTLFADLMQIRAQKTPPDPTVPKPIFTYRPAGATLAGGGAAAAPGITVTMKYQGGSFQNKSDWVWDPAGSCWKRYHQRPGVDNAPIAHVDSNGTQVCPANVVVLFVPVGPDVAVDARTPKAETTGTGTGFVLADGKAANINWARATPSDPWTFADDSGAPVSLTPGTTWVELADRDTDSADILDAGAAQALLGS